MMLNIFYVIYTKVEDIRFRYRFYHLPVLKNQVMQISLIAIP